MHLKKIIIASLWVSILSSFIACSNKGNSHSITSPDQSITLDFVVNSSSPTYSIVKDDKMVMNQSVLGYEFKQMPTLQSNLEVIKTETRSINETWEQVWGERRLVENRCEELSILLKEKEAPSRELELIFRVFNDGVAFRYHIPKQNGLDSLTIMNELTAFNLSEVENAWWIPAYKEPFYESIYRNNKINEINDTVCTPITLEMNNGLYVAIHEANLTDYAAINLYANEQNGFNTDLSPWSTGEKVFTKAGMYSPWRTITIGESAGNLITSYMDVNLNEPNKIEDVSWIKPGKYIGIWWSIHMGKHTWKRGPNHGATTENTKQYMDFAAENGFDGVLVEGWNDGWDFDWTREGNRISFTKAYADFDLEEITNYGKKLGVKLIGHHETGGITRNYENQMDDAFALYQSVGVHDVKTGYVNVNNLDGIEYHSSQYGVRHYRKVIETAAKYQITIDNHEPAMFSGLRRTYPNLMTGEGVRGQEYDAWSQDGGNAPDHTTIVPFTRGLAGPIDFTFGTFNFENTAVPGTRVQTTLAKQLALYVVIYSPLQMASDEPENYKGQKAFDFIKDVPTDWAETTIINGEIGEYITTVRKDRNSEEWFLGSITNEESRELNISLDFLGHNKKYKAEIYADGTQADWKINPTDFQYTEQFVSAKDSLQLTLAKGGGSAIRFVVIE